MAYQPIPQAQPFPGGQPFPLSPHQPPPQAQPFPGGLPFPPPFQFSPNQIPQGTTTELPPSKLIPINFMPLYVYPHSNPYSDADKLHSAMKGLGTDDSKLIDILTHRSKLQLDLIDQAYLSRYKKTLRKDIKGDTSGNYGQLLRELSIPILPYKIKKLKKALKGAGAKDAALIDILTQTSNTELQQIKRALPNIEADLVKDHANSSYRKTLQVLCKAKRQEITTIDDTRAEEVAKEVHDIGDFKHNDSKLIEIFTKYSPYFLDRVEAHYQNLYKRSMIAIIEKETSGHFRDVLVALAKPPDIYFADRLKQTTKGLGTDDLSLIYIFCIHDRAQLKHMAKIYSNRGHGSLIRDIEGDTSGDYKKALLSLFN